MRENVNYEVECVREGCDYVYLGETCRNAWSRGKEHLRGIQKKDSDSVFVEHIRECHESLFVHGPFCLQNECQGVTQNSP